MPGVGGRGMFKLRFDWYIVTALLWIVNTGSIGVRPRANVEFKSNLIRRNYLF